MGNALMETAGELIGGILSLVLGLAFLGFLIYLPFWLLGKLRDRVRAEGIGGVLPGVAPRIDGIALQTATRPPALLPQDYPARYARARKLLCGAFHQPDPGELPAGTPPDSWNKYLLPQWSVTGFDTLFVHVAPGYVQAMDISPRRCTFPGLLDGLATEDGTGAVVPGSGSVPGSRFDLVSIEAGAECAGPGLHVVLRAKAKGTFPPTTSPADCPCLYVGFEVAGWGQAFSLVPPQDKPAWEFNQTVYGEFGIMDFAGEIPYVAQIVLFPGGRLDDFAHMVPLSNAATGTIDVQSRKIPL